MNFFGQIFLPRKILPIVMIGVSAFILQDSAAFALKCKADQPAQENCVRQHASAEIVFVLDTTGSMSSLIAGAKKKIWSIVTQIVEIDENADVRLGLVGYRDRKDAYVTKFHNLSDDLDNIYSKLVTFQAAGGGDTPESVNQALYEAVTRSDWTYKKDVLRMVFLVGDAPPHMDYKDDIKYPETLKIARKHDIIVSTLQAGTMKSTVEFWQNIAKLGNGDYAQIPQSGNVQVITSPYDKDIQKLQNELNKTTLPYGNRAQLQKVREKRRANEAAAPSVAASRSYYRFKKARKRAGVSKRVISGKNSDLLADVERGEVKLDALKKEELPKEMRDMSTVQRRQYLLKKKAQRAAIEDRLKKIVRKRASFMVKKKKQLRSKPGRKEGFDELISLGASTRY